jgi:7-dehydrocholesterol reductase
MSPSGHVPVYKANGVQCYVITLATYAYIVYAGHYELGYVYAHFGELLAFMNVFSLAFCALLFVKGHVAPSSTDHGSSGNWVIDYYWGMELYPRIFGVDVKQFTNCRFGMMAWALYVANAHARDVFVLFFLCCSLGSECIRVMCFCFAP